MIDMSDCANVYMWLVTYEFVTGREATDLLLLRGIRRRRYDQSSNRSVDKGGQAGGTAHGTWLGTPLCLRLKDIYAVSPHNRPAQRGIVCHCT